MGRDTFENWQSEFLQLLCAILRIVGGHKAEELIADLDRHYMRTDGASPHGHDAELARSAGRDIPHVAQG